MSAATLVIDIGNTSTSMGLFRNGRIYKVQRCPSNAPELHFSGVERAVIASVKPPVDALWDAALDRQGIEQVLRVNHELNLGVPLCYPAPETVGADRLANACAGVRLYGAPVVVCDFGTALTFDVIVKETGYSGGIICPGLPLMFDYLAERTALLPHIKPAKIAHAVGRNTKEAMRIGARLGYRGMVREVLAALQKELGVRKLNVCATGGFAEWVLKDWDMEIPVDKNLTLKGLGFIGELNF